MELVEELRNEIALAVLVKKSGSKSDETEDLLKLIGQISEVLKPVSARDHISDELEEPRRGPVSVIDRAQEKSS